VLSPPPSSPRVDDEVPIPCQYTMMESGYIINEDQFDKER